MEYMNSPRMQRVIAAEKLSEHLRGEPLLPLKFKYSDEVYTDVDSGICLPRWHCFFSGRRACADVNNSEAVVQEKGIWQHIWNEKKHQQILISLIHKHRLQQHLENLEFVAFSLMSEAVAVKERSHIPLVGASLDRRALQSVGEVIIYL